MQRHETDRPKCSVVSGKGFGTLAEVVLSVEWVSSEDVFRKSLFRRGRGR